MAQTQNNRQSSPDDKCSRWRIILHELKLQHSAYLLAYGECITEKTTLTRAGKKSNEPVSFEECGKLKDKMKTTILNLKSEVDIMHSYSRFIDSLNIGEGGIVRSMLKAKLMHLAQKEAYRHAVKNAKALNSKIKTPSHRAIVRELMQLDKALLESIAYLGKPTLIIVPDMSFTALMNAANKNSKTHGPKPIKIDTKQNIQDKPGNNSICIIDMVRHVADLISPVHRADETELYNEWERSYTAQGLHMIDPLEYMAAIHHSLCEYKRARQMGQNGTEQLIDYNSGSEPSFTLCGQDTPVDEENFVFGSYSVGENQFSIHKGDASDYAHYLCGRGGFKLMQI